MKKLLALAIVASLTGVSATANADDNLGCTFLLCMGAPNPMSVKECVSPVKTVLKRLAKGKGIPHCAMSDGRSSKLTGNYVDYTRATPTPSCPAGYRQGSDGVIYHQGKKPVGASSRVKYNGGIMSSKSDNKDKFTILRGDGYKTRACIKGNVNGHIDAYTYFTRKNGESQAVTVPRQEWVDSTVLMKPDGATYEFYMYTDGKLFSKHRF